MLRISCLVFCVVVGHVIGDETIQPGPAEFGFPPHDRPSATIVGGEDARPGEFPWQVSLQVVPIFGSRFHNCGGSILNETTIVSAGHCIGSRNVRRLEVVAGAHNIKADESFQQRVVVRRVIVHPRFNVDKMTNDVSLLFLEKPLKFNERVQPIRLPRPSDPPTGKKCVNTGWGNANPQGSTPTMIPDVLQKVELEVIDNTDCANRFDGINNVDDGMICAAGRNIKGGCNGDSGGPFACQGNDGYYLAGIVSWGFRPCAQDRYATVYTRVSKYVNYISGHL